MDDRELARKFQQLKSMSNKRFWQEMNNIHTKAYAKGMKHMQEAMGCHQRISKTMVDEVLLKAEEIREQWDGLKTVTVEDTESDQFKTATELIHNLTATEAYIFDLESEAVVTVAGRKFLVRPLSLEEKSGE